jgi:TatD DNase family protein
VLVDTHCHLGDAAFDEDRTEVVERARAAGIEHAVIAADSPDATDRARALAATTGWWATAGVHPHEARGWDAPARVRIAGALADLRVVAVGETGLDYHYDHSPRPDQRRAFADQLELGARHDLPVVVHARSADEDVAAMLRALDPGRPVVILHSFSAGAAVLDAGLAIGAYFSFSGMITFRNWHGHDAVARCPADRLLIETDAPYLAPVPHRGHRNEPAFIRHVADRLAELRGVNVADLEHLTTLNAMRCFGRIAQPATIP